MTRWRWLAGVGLGLAAALAALLWWRPVVQQQPAAAAASIAAHSAAVPAARYVGAATCAGCHQSQYQAWQGSHHQLAMAPASAATVLAPFRGERSAQDGNSSSFRQRDGHFYARTQGPDGHVRDFEVTHTLGWQPLQQYLVAMPDGGMQALTSAWDNRPREQGGQRWYELQAGQHTRPGEPLHWSGRQYNWNFMCADCHTTGFKKNFDVALRRYRSAWSEGNVACEACHGPGSAHLAWAGLSPAERARDAGMGLVRSLGERKLAQWVIDPASGNAVRGTPPPLRRTEVDTCARCHAHRSQISDDDAKPGASLLDTHLPSLIDKNLFWPDGQMRAEVYNHASFQQSKMFEKGVTCSDCHNPHSGKLKASGNQVCLQCHAAPKYEAPAHHFHRMGGPGASCAACHMPVTTYMGIDARHDHGIRVPRPDLSPATGSPNACNTCHSDKSTPWAAEWAGRWYPALAKRHAPLSEALAASSGDRLDAQALQLLLGVMGDGQRSPVARSTALARAAPALRPEQWRLATPMLADADPLVRASAADSLAYLPPDQRAPLLRPLLADPVRAVRIAAARWLAGAPTQGWSAEDLAALAAATAEYVAVQTYNGDRPEAHNNLGGLYADQADWPRAEAALRQAIAQAPDFLPSYLNLADAYAQQGRELEAQAQLRALLQRQPGAALAHHALGLSLLRQHKPAEALAALRRARDLEPGNTRFAYVYAAALKESRPAARAAR